MMRYFGVLGVTALSICGALARADDLAVDDDRFDPNWGVTFSAAAAKEVAFLNPATVTWTPTAADIAQLEMALIVPLKARLARERGAALYPRDYYRQYVGIVRDGKQLVAVNGFHRSFVEGETKLCRAESWGLYGGEMKLEGQSICPSTSGHKSLDFWKQEWIVVFDGGCDFFQATFDIEKGVIIAVNCDGHA